MNLEEYLTYHDLMRMDRDRIQAIADDLYSQGEAKDQSILGLKQQIAQIEEDQRSGKQVKQT